MPKLLKQDHEAVHETGDYTEKKMLLSVPGLVHEMIRNITEAVPELTQPKVVNFILAETLKRNPKEIVEKIQRVAAEKRLQELAIQETAIEEERKRLTNVLEQR